MTRGRFRDRPGLSARRALAESEQHVLDVPFTLATRLLEESVRLRVLTLHCSPERQSEGKGPGVHLRILERRLVADPVRTDRREALTDAYLVAIEVADHVEPCLVVLVGDVDV